MPTKTVRHAVCLLATITAVFNMAPHALAAGSTNIASHVTAATLFPDRAIVTREARAHIPAGALDVTVTDIPNGMDEASLRVQGKATHNVKIGNIEIKSVFLTDLATNAEREKQAALDTKTNEKAMIDGDIRAVETRINFINHLVQNGANNHTSDNLTKLDFAPEKWGQAITLLQSNMAAAQKELVNHQIALHKAEADIAKLQAEMDQVRSTQARQRRDAIIHVEADQESDLTLAMTYQTTGATWQPVYDARLDTAADIVDMELYGQVSQQTGEDWSDIDLSLSTTRPANGTEMPTLREWMINLWRPVERMAVQSVANFSGLASMDAAPRAAMKMAAPAAVPMMEATQTVAIAQTTDYAAEFHIPGHVNLKSTQDSSKMLITTSKLKAKLTAETTPRLMPQAFLFAKVTNDQDYPLLAGHVAKYRDGVFIGNAVLPLLRAKESADLSFGTDDRLKVTYKKKNDVADNPALSLVGDAKIERSYQTTIKNLHKDPVQVTVFDQYPVSSDGDVKVDVTEEGTTAGYAKDPDNRQGVVTWAVNLAPQEEKSVSLSFRIRYPKGKQINGL